MIVGKNENSDMTSFENMKVWQISMILMQKVYVLSKKFPSEESYDLTRQIRKASKSILANLAEGCSRYTFTDKASKFVIARGECAEVRAFLLMAIALNYLAKQEAEEALKLQEEVSRMLSGLIKTCRNQAL